MKYYDCTIELKLIEPIDLGRNKMPILSIRVPTIWITAEQLQQVLLAYKESGRYSEIKVFDLKERKQWW